ncbi:MAG TPA: hypothetical protein PLV31_05585 [Gammaproteobacteria bacterium]|nr:hypothetical protein [Gammaproteobacteria bacterium]HRA43134.1 hypothetical protein [Gammaproteobacteria bacterium]
MFLLRVLGGSCCITDDAADDATNDATKPLLIREEGSKAKKETKETKETETNGDSDVSSIIVEVGSNFEPSVLCVQSEGLKEPLDLTNAAIEQLEAIGTQNNLLLERVKLLNSKNAELEKEKAQITSAQAVLSSILKTLQEEIVDAKVQLELAKGKNEQLQKQLQDKEPPSYDSLSGQEQTQKKPSQQELHQETAGKASAQSALSSLEAESQALRAQLDAVSIENEKLKRQLQEGEAQNRTLSENVAALTAEVTEQKKLQERITEIQATLQQETNKKASTEVQLLSLDMKLQSLQSQLEESVLEIKTLTEGKVVLENQLQQQEISLRAELQNAEARNRSVAEAAAALNREKVELQEQLAQKETEKLSVQSELQERLTEAQSVLQGYAEGSPVKKYPGLKLELQELQEGFKVAQAELQVKSQQLNHPLVKKIFG